MSSISLDGIYEPAGNFSELEPFPLDPPMGELEVSDSDTSDWDRTLYNLSSKLTEPFCWAFKQLRYRLVTPLGDQFTNYANNVQEIGYRALIVSGAIALSGAAIVAPIPVLGSIIGLGALSKVLRVAAMYFQKDGFTPIRGNLAPIAVTHPPKILTWNICAAGGGIPLDHGGVIDWRDSQPNGKTRIEGIIEKLREEDADVVVLQEVYDAAAGETILAALSDRYAHFYTHTGPNLMGSEMGVMVFTKYDATFSSRSFEGNSWTMNRVFTALDLKKSPSDPTPCFRVIGTHLIHTDDDDGRAGRKDQLAQIQRFLEGQSKCPTFLAADLNIQRDEVEGEQLKTYLTHGYTLDAPTCSNDGVRQWQQEPWNGEWIDYVSLFTNTGPQVFFSNAHLVAAFDEPFNTRTALSDHNGVCVTVNYEQLP